MTRIYFIFSNLTNPYCVNMKSKKKIFKIESNTVNNLKEKLLKKRKILKPNTILSLIESISKKSSISDSKINVLRKTLSKCSILSKNHKKSQKHIRKLFKAGFRSTLLVKLLILLQKWEAEFKKTLKIKNQKFQARTQRT